MSLPTWIRINTRNQVESSSSPVFWPCIDRIRHEGGRKMKTALQFDWKLNVSFASPAHFGPTKSGNRAWHPIRHFYTRNSVDCVSTRVNKLAWRMMIDSNPFWQLMCTQIVIRGRFSSIVSTFFTEKARRNCVFFRWQKIRAIMFAQWITQLLYNKRKVPLIPKWWLYDPLYEESDLWGKPRSSFVLTWQSSRITFIAHSLRTEVTNVARTRMYEIILRSF